MPRVHFVKKARKDYPEDGIKKGESYYWWKFRYGGKIRSKTHPKRWQLTQSPFLQEVYSIEEDLENISVDTNQEPSDIESEIESYLDDIKTRIEDLRDECEEKLENMPEQLQDTSDAGMLLQERIDALEDWLDELDNIDISIDENLTNDELEERVDKILFEIGNCVYGGR